MNLNDIYDELLEACQTIDGLNIAPVMSESINTPAIVPDAPNDVQFDMTYDNGMSSAELVLKVVASRTSVADGVSLLLELVSTDGPRSVKNAIESAEYTSLDEITVMRAENFGSMQYNSVSYLVCDLVIEVIPK